MELLGSVSRFGGVGWEDELQEGVLHLMFADTNAPQKGRKESASVLEELYGQEKEEVYRTTLNREYGKYEYKCPTRTEVMLLGIAGGAVDEGIDEVLHVQ